MGLFSNLFDDLFDDFLGVDPSGGGIFDIIPGGEDLFKALQAAGLFEEGSGARQGLGALLGSVALDKLGIMDPKIPQTGYAGGIPDYEIARRQVPVATGIEQINQTVRPMGAAPMGADDTVSTGRAIPLMYDPNRRPGSGGRRYFTDIEYVPTGRDLGEDKAVDSGAMTAAQTRQDQQSYDLLRQNVGNLAREERAQKTDELPLMAGPMPAKGSFARGGITALKKGTYLNGNTDGMADKVPATIDGKQPAALSDGEFVIPADVVSHLGNGNSDAGAKVLEQMMARVRKERTGNKEQGKEINARNMLPA